MRTGSITPSISVDIGGQLRLYHAFVTTAPFALDGPSTMTLHTSTFADVAGFAASPIPFQAEFGRKTARLVLIEATELAWHRAQYRGHHCLLAPADPELLGLKTLQHWLWQRLSAPAAAEALSS